MSDGKNREELQKEYDTKFDEIRDKFFEDRKVLLDKHPEWRGQDSPESDKVYSLTKEYYASIKELQEEYSVLFEFE